MSDRRVVVFHYPAGSERFDTERFDPKPRRQKGLLGSLQERVCYWHCFCRLGCGAQSGG